MADVKKLAEELVNLKVTEVNELATILKEEYGIEPAAAAVAVAAPAAGAGEAAAAEKSPFDVRQNFRLSRSLRTSPVFRWATLKLSLTALPRLLKRVSPRKRPSRSRLSLRRLVLKLSLSSIAA